MVLKTRQITFNKTICSTILLKNLAFPLVVWGCMALFNSPTTLTRLVVVALAIPTVTMPSTLAIRFNVHEAELASTQFWSTALSFITLTAFVLALS
ncbi:AEC family transporter [Limosilactobacillus fermentum]